MKKAMILIVIAVMIAGAAVYWWVHHFAGTSPDELRLYGNVDLRQVNLAFNGNERIETVLSREGDRVKKGQVVGTLEMERLTATAAQAEARAKAQRHVVERLENGTRPQEIDQARANLNAAKADLTNAKLNYERMGKSAGGGATSRQDLDTAKAAFEVAEAKLRVNQKALDLAVIGPRKEDIAEARATLLADEAELAVSRQNLAYATLVSPTNGVVQNRILEPGEMASPQRAVLTIAITDPKWVRVYAGEPDLGKIRMGMTAAVSTDSFPGKKYDGWVGFISPIAAFTPKTVETTDLRTSLVYEVRIFVKDPADELRLGMPATVQIPLTGGDSQNGGGSTENRGG
ncbi:MAG: efflux RND transporter periplasmic adaptor subunit [Syntrophobacteraceae bacterium]|jgi:HlyD family secretion protein